MLTRQISSPVTQLTKHDPIKQIHISVCHSSSLLQSNLTHQPWCVWTACFDCQSCEWWIWPGARWGVPAGWRQCPACRVMAWLDDPSRRTCFAKVGTKTCLHMRGGMCSFSNRWQRSGDWREKTRVREGGTVCGFLFSSLWLLLFIYPLPLPGDRNVANLVFICL